jgi:copper-binding protein NosD
MRHLTQLVAVSVLGIVAAQFIGVSPAIAQDETCQFAISPPGPITSTVVLTQQGVYCLFTDVSTDVTFTSGNAISIETNNVILNLNGHKVGGLAAGPTTQATGIYANQRINVTVKNGTVRGFRNGILLDDTTNTTAHGYLVEGIRAEQNTVRAIQVFGQGNAVRRNYVFGTGIGTSPGTSAIGITASGAQARVLDNDVIETVGANGAFAYGIFAGSATSSVIEGNRVSNQTSPGTKGIFLSFTSNTVTIVNNRLLGWTEGVSVGSGSAKCRDNFFNDVTTNLINCTDVANNN